VLPEKVEEPERDRRSGEGSGTETIFSGGIRAERAEGHHAETGVRFRSRLKKGWLGR